MSSKDGDPYLQITRTPVLYVLSGCGPSTDLTLYTSDTVLASTPLVNFSVTELDLI